MEKRVIGLLIGIFACANLGSRPPSLSNVGNTCYFNSLIQNLYNLEPITEALLAQKGTAQPPLIQQYAGLIAQFRAGQTSRFEGDLGKLSTKLFEVGKASGGLEAGEQGDPTEAFTYLANPGGVTAPVFEEKMGITFGDNISYQKADGTYEKPSLSVSKNKELYLVVPYPSEFPVTQTALLKNFFTSGFFEGNPSGFHAPCIVGVCPEILMVWVKVFKGDFDKITNTYTSSRIATNFDGASFLNPLDIKDFVVVDGKGFKDLDTIYNLIGVSCQSGSLSGGHYIALIKDQYDPERRWYYCSDSVVDEIDEKSVGEHIKDQAYVFFYRKKSSEEASIARQRGKQTESDLRNLANVLCQLAQPDSKKK